MSHPATEGDCLGHDQVFEAFRRTLSRGRLASTYLFVGDTGIGKRTAANAIAKALLCTSTPDEQLTACGACQSCQLVETGNHPDLLTVALPEGKSSLPIDLFIGAGDKRNREGLCHDIALRPMLGARRIAIIDDADQLGVESANCLLKTLEEPPPGSLILLIATSPQRVLPTIRSRSQVVRFKPLANECVVQILQRVGAAENQAEAEQLAAACRGSVSRAIASTDEELLSLRPELEQALQGDDFDPVALAARVQESLGGGATDAATRRRRLQGVLDLAVDTLRGDLRQLRSTVSTLRRLDACLDARQHLDRNANQAMLVQWWLDQVWRSAPRRG